jgi:hypothetical protein
MKTYVVDKSCNREGQLRYYVVSKEDIDNSTYEGKYLQTDGTWGSGVWVREGWQFKTRREAIQKLKAKVGKCKVVGLYEVLT